LEREKIYLGIYIIKKIFFKSKFVNLGGW